MFNDEHLIALLIGATLASVIIASGADAGKMFSVEFALLVVAEINRQRKAGKKP